MKPLSMLQGFTERSGILYYPYKYKVSGQIYYDGSICEETGGLNQFISMLDSFFQIQAELVEEPLDMEDPMIDGFSSYYKKYITKTLK